MCTEKPREETLKERLRSSASLKSSLRVQHSETFKGSDLAEWMNKCFENLMDLRIKFDTEDWVSIESSLNIRNRTEGKNVWPTCDKYMHSIMSET